MSETTHPSAARRKRNTTGNPSGSYQGAQSSSNRNDVTIKEEPTQKQFKHEQSQQNVFAKPELPVHRETKIAKRSTPNQLQNRMVSPGQFKVPTPGRETSFEKSPSICWIASDGESMERESKKEEHLEQDEEEANAAYMSDLLHAPFPYRLSTSQIKELEESRRAAREKEKKEIENKKKERHRRHKKARMKKEEDDPNYVSGIKRESKSHLTLEQQQEEARARQVDRTLRLHYAGIEVLHLGLTPPQTEEAQSSSARVLNVYNYDDDAEDTEEVAAYSAHMKRQRMMQSRRSPDNGTNDIVTLSDEEMSGNRTGASRGVNNQDSYSSENEYEGDYSDDNDSAEDEPENEEEYESPLESLPPGVETPPPMSGLDILIGRENLVELQDKYKPDDFDVNSFKPGEHDPVYYVNIVRRLQIMKKTCVRNKIPDPEYDNFEFIGVEKQGMEDTPPPLSPNMEPDPEEMADMQEAIERTIREENAYATATIEQFDELEDIARQIEISKKYGYIKDDDGPSYELPGPKPVPVMPIEDLERRISSPERRISSPERRISSPERRISSPERRVFSPEKHISSPEIYVFSPKRRISKSKKRICRPKRPTISNSYDFEDFDDFARREIQKEEDRRNRVIEPLDEEEATKLIHELVDLVCPKKKRVKRRRTKRVPKRKQKRSPITKYKFAKPSNVRVQFNPFKSNAERHERLMQDLKRRQIRVDEERAAKEAARRAAREAETIAKGKTPRRKLPPSGLLYMDPNRNYKAKKFTDIKKNEPRPVIYRLKALTSQQLRTQKRTRVTRQIIHAKIPQFHLEHHELTQYRNVAEQSLFETVESYLEASKPFMQKSDKFFDEYVATAVEYDNTVKMLHFGFTLKKHSCKQKRLKFQTTWWQRKRQAFEKPKSGLFGRPASPVYRIQHDAALYKKHFLLPPGGQSPIQKIRDLLAWRCRNRRTDNYVIPDTTFFAREFFLTKCSISFRIERSSDIPDVFVPPTLNAGYFPHSAIKRKQKMHYLACRYQEAQMEYLSLTYRNMVPPRGYRLGKITKEELLEYHFMGRHIHGFFVVWESEREKHYNKNNKLRRKRYLVDMFCHQWFPIDIEYRRWDRQLKLAFDKTVAYNLNFAESIRVNRPVYDKLAENKSMFNKITLKEMGNYMKEAEINTKYLLSSVGKYEFYNKGLFSTNALYLSAFFIIVGASKNLKSSRLYDLGKIFVYANDPMAPGIQTRDGQMYDVDSGVVPTKILLASEDYSKSKTMEEIEFVYPLSKDAANTSRIVRDLPIIAPKTPPAPKKIRKECIPIAEYPILTRKKLIRVRARMYKYPMPKPPKKQPEPKIKKKPGRKPETPLDRGLKKNDFHVVRIPSDAESEYEGYLSQEEGHVDRCPKLKRTLSADSIFIEPAYTDYRFNKLSWFHQQYIPRPKQTILQKRRRKMNKIRLKHTLRYWMLQQEAHAFREMIECYHGNMPRTNKEIANTKNCIRNPHKFAKMNIPKVYGPGDAPFVDTIAMILKEAVTHTVALEHAGIRVGNTITRDLQKARVEQHDLLINLPTKNNVYLPSPEYLSMELLSMERMTSYNALDYYARKIREDLEEKVETRLKMPRYEQEYLMRMNKMKIDKREFENYWKHQKQREIQFDKSLKIVYHDNRSLQAQQKKDRERKVARRYHAARALARSKLSEAELEQVLREDKIRKEEQEKERRQAQALAKKQRALRAELEKRQAENKVKTELEKREELAREWHRDQMIHAELEILKLKTEGRKHHERLHDLEYDNSYMGARKRRLEMQKKLDEMSWMERNKYEEEERKKKDEARRREDERIQKIEKQWRQHREEQERDRQAELGVKALNDDNTIRLIIEYNRQMKVLDDYVAIQRKALDYAEKRNRIEALELKRQKRQAVAEAKRKKEEEKKKEQEEEEKRLKKLEEEKKEEEKEKAEKKKKEEEEAQRKRKEEERKKNEEEKAEREKLKKEAEAEKKKKEDERIEKERLQREAEADKKKKEEEKAEREKIQREAEVERKRLEQKARVEKERLDKEARERAEIARLKKEATKQAKVVVASHEIDLLTVSKDLSNPEFKNAIAAFQVIDCRGLLSNSFPDFDRLFASDVFKSTKHIAGKLVRYVRALIEKGKRKESKKEEENKVPIDCEHLFKNVASCYMFNKQTKKWRFDYNVNRLLKDVPIRMRRRIEAYMENPNQPLSTMLTKTPGFGQNSLMRDAFPRIIPASTILTSSLKAVTPHNPDMSQCGVFSSVVNNSSFNIGANLLGTTPRHASNRRVTTRNIFSRDDTNAQNTSAVLSKWNPPEVSNTPFWKSVNCAERSGKDGQRQKTAEMLVNKISQDFVLQKNSANWIFPILGACYALVIDKKKLDENLKEFISEESQVYQVKDNTHVKEVANDLAIISSFFEEGNKSPKNFAEIIKYNGFQIVFEPLKALLSKFYDLVAQLNMPSIVKPTTTVVDCLSLVFKAVGDECELMISNQYSIPSKEVSFMRNDENDVANHIIEERSFHPSRRVPEVHHEDRMNIVINWGRAVRKQYGYELREKRTIALDNIVIDYSKMFDHYEKTLSLNNTMQQENVVEENISSPPGEDADCYDNDFGMHDDSDGRGSQASECCVEILPDNLVRVEHETPIQEMIELPVPLEVNMEQNEILIKVDCTVRMPTAKQIKMKRDAFKKQKLAQIRSFNKFSLPTYNSKFIEHAWRTIYSAFHSLSEAEKKRLTLYDNYSDLHTNMSINRFHPMIEIDPTKTPLEQMKNGGCEDPYKWRNFKRQRIEQSPGACRKTENYYLRSFENIVMSQQEFREMKWQVPRRNGKPIQAIEFFTNLTKYRSEKYFRRAAHNGYLPIEYNIYDHLWFMGCLLPRSFSASSHEDMPDGYCAGCTKGDVVFITRCTCDAHPESLTNKFIYTSASYNVEIGRVTRFLGRFVCEHGPSSCLALDNIDGANEHEPVENGDREWKPRQSSYKTFDTKLWLIRKKTMYRNLLEDICEHPKSKEKRAGSVESSTSSSSEESSSEESDFEDTDYEEDPLPPTAFETELPTLIDLQKMEKMLYMNDEKELSEDQKYFYLESTRIQKQMRRCRPIRRVEGRTFRSNSADAPILEKPGSIEYFSYSASMTNLNELTKYARNKVEKTKKKFRKVFGKVESSTNTLVEEKMMNAMSFFDGFESATSAENFEIMASMFDCGYRIENNASDEINAVFYTSLSDLVDQFGILRVVGEITDNIDFDDEKGYVGNKFRSVVLDEYYKFKLFMESRGKMADRAVCLVNKHKVKENDPFKKLIMCYEKIFRFNCYLLQHLLELAIQRIFNPFAVYYAEINQDSSQIEKAINEVKDEMHCVMSKLFNLSPLERQLEDLRRVKHMCTPEEMVSHVASLARYAIERVRVPQTAEKSLNQFSWINSTPSYEDTFDVFTMKADISIPFDLDRDEYAAKLENLHYVWNIVKEHSLSFTKNCENISTHFVLGFYAQSDQFYSSLSELMPNGLIDPKIKALYQHQSFEKIRNILARKTHVFTYEDISKMDEHNVSIVIPALAELSKETHMCDSPANNLDFLYSSLSAVTAKPLPVRPSAIGLAFVCLNHRLYFSVVREKEIFVTTQLENRYTPPLKETEEMQLVNTSNTPLCVVVDKHLSRVTAFYYNQSEGYVNDRFIIGFVPKLAPGQRVDWNDIRRRLVTNQVNGLMLSLDNWRNSPNSSPTSDPIGRLERPLPLKVNEPPVGRNAHRLRFSVRELPDGYCSETDDEESPGGEYSDTDDEEN